MSDLGQEMPSDLEPYSIAHFCEDSFDGTAYGFVRGVISRAIQERVYDISAARGIVERIRSNIEGFEANQLQIERLCVVLATLIQLSKERERRKFGPDRGYLNTLIRLEKALIDARELLTETLDKALDPLFEGRKHQPSRLWIAREILCASTTGISSEDSCSTPEQQSLLCARPVLVENGHIEWQADSRLFDTERAVSWMILLFMSFGKDATEISTESGRPPTKDLSKPYIQELAEIFEETTGQKATAWRDPTRASPFLRFISILTQEVRLATGIDLTGILPDAKITRGILRDRST